MFKRILKLVRDIYLGDALRFPRIFEIHYLVEFSQLSSMVAIALNVKER